MANRHLRSKSRNTVTNRDGTSEKGVSQNDTLIDERIAKLKQFKN